MGKIFLLMFSVIMLLGEPIGYKEDVRWSNRLVIKFKKDLINNILPDPERMQYLRFVREQCKPYNLEYTCMAIAWKESKYNTWGFNEVTGDYGLMGINLKWYLTNKGIKAGYWKKKAIATKLVRDDLLNITYSISELLTWKRKLDNDWIEIWARYNGGNVSPNYEYSKDILNRIIVLKRYLKE